MYNYWLKFVQLKSLKACKIVLGQLSKIAAVPDPKFWKWQNFFFKTAKLVEQFCKVYQNNPSGNSHMLLTNSQT